jgi:radical SAM/Cys-rich protein
MYSGTAEKTAEPDDKASGRTEPFKAALLRHDLKLVRERTHTLQINVGLRCNQICKHCHLNAGPGRTENMGKEIVKQVISYAERSRFDCIDITGGAPELNPNITDLIEGLSPKAPRIMFRSNLSALNDGTRDFLMDLLKSTKIVIFASFPSLNEAQTASQRGEGIFGVSVDALRKLNALGYGQSGTGLELNLVSNPTGAFLPPSQSQTEKRFRQVLKKKWGVVFNQFFSFANVPLGRFHKWLIKSGNYESYLKKLADAFNPCAVESVMCRTLVSVSWDGYLYDCDFNLARGLDMGGRPTHISHKAGPPEQGKPIVTADHCYTCTAGAGFT